MDNAEKTERDKKAAILTHDTWEYEPKALFIIAWNMASRYRDQQEKLNANRTKHKNNQSG